MICFHNRKSVVLDAGQCFQQFYKYSKKLEGKGECLGVFSTTLSKTLPQDLAVRILYMNLETIQSFGLIFLGSRVVKYVSKYSLSLSLFFSFLLSLLIC